MNNTVHITYYIRVRRSPCQYRRRPANIEYICDLLPGDMVREIHQPRTVCFDYRAGGITFLRVKQFPASGWRCDWNTPINLL